MSSLKEKALDQKKFARRSLKKKVRENYKRLKNIIKLEILYTTSKDLMVELDPSRFEIYDYPYELALFIIMKKLESQGYRVELRKGKETSYLFRNDRLYISLYSKRRFL